MTTFVALLRAVNVGGTGVLRMPELSTLCTSVGFESVRTYIQSGNVVFQSRRSEEHVRTDMERALTEKMGKRIDVIVRSASELRSILESNPFPNAHPARVAIVFFTEPIASDMLDRLVVPGMEEIRPGRRELYIHYPDGMGRSKLKLPSRGTGTARNINTVARLVAMAMA